MDTRSTAARAVAIVGVGAILPDAPNAPAFWQNVKDGRYSVSEVDPARWDPALYYDADPAAPDKTYSKIGAFVRTSPWDPIAWKLPIPPRVSDAMDEAQKWAIACTREALTDFGWPARPLDLERTAVILGNAMAGERHYQTSLRISYPEYARLLEAAPSFGALPDERRTAIAAELLGGVQRRLPAISEDTMPGELANCMAGRIANLFNFHGPNFVVDAACASAMAAMATAVEGLLEGDYDVALTGGIDRNMGAATYVKFCKIGALSATGTRPYADGADGFVMGEGAAIFVLKRLEDAERAGDRIHAVLRGIGGASDGRGKGITAPNPVGQRLAIERAWKNAGLTPGAGLLVEGHGTSTRVGDVVEVQSLQDAFGSLGLPPRSIALGSVKSNIGHLKGAAGAAGILKAVLALRDKVLPASLHFDRPNPNIDFARTPFRVPTSLEPWETRNGDVRRAAVSAFGFGGTDFHAVLEEHVPGRLRGDAVRRSSVVVPRGAAAGADTPKAPLRGALLIGADSVAALADRLAAIERAAGEGTAPPPAPPAAADLRAPERLAIDYGDAAELADKAAKARKALASDHPGMWKALRAQGVFRGRGAAAKVAFLYTGQGSQYPNMLRSLRADEPVVADTFDEADRVMTPLLGTPLSAIVFCDPDDPERVAAAAEDLRQTAITQPAVLTTDLALTRLLAAYGVVPDFVMGHSLGEYGALVAAGSLSFGHALEAVSARGREMSSLNMGDNGRMAAVFAPLAEIERIVAGIDGYVVVANVNSTSQSVIGGTSEAVERAIAAFQAANYNAMAIPVSHAFHTSIVAPASVPLRATLARLGVRAPIVPVVANVTGEFYPQGPDVESAMLDLLARQVASPVQFVRGLDTLYAAGARVFIEVGPKKALQGFADDVLGDRADVVSLFTNHPKLADAVAFNQALCGLFAAGVGAGAALAAPRDPAALSEASAPSNTAPSAAPPVVVAPPLAASDDRYRDLGRLFASVLEPGWRLLGGADPGAAAAPLVISGAALGLPGTERIFDDGNLGRLLHGAQLIDVIPTRFRHAMLDKHITRLVKREEGGPTFETIERPEDVIKLAGRGGAFDLGSEFGVSAERIAAFDVCTRLAIAAGIDALRDAGIPLVMRYRATTTGSHLPEGWRLPAGLRDDTGVIFASAFPGYDAFADELTRYHEDQARHALVAELEHLRTRAAAAGEAHDVLVAELDRRLHEVKDELARQPYVFDRRFLFRVLAMGHSQFAELIGARGPNTQINAACASTTQAVALAEDWIRAGRCRRVIVIAADDATSDRLLEWVGAGFLASGAAATDEDVASAALPFDRRRHGMIVGMGAAAFVVETAEAVRERGLAPICEVLGAVTANSAFHGTRLDVTHICGVMESLMAAAERRWGIDRHAIASSLLFVSHETYTPARGGSAAAEVEALRRVFGADAARIVVANTKGLTGHPMGVGIEDVVAVKALETGLVPPVPNFKEVDPELGALTLSQGGAYPVEYALRLGAGFGSQISMSLIRRVPARDGVRRAPADLGFRYRVVEPQAWDAWLANAAGHAAAEVEVVTHQLRLKDHGPPARIDPRVTTPAAPARPAAVARDSQPAPVVPAAPAPAPAAAAPAADAVRERILTLVEEKTGYPRDMLDVELDLEADLGVDTVKQAEMFAAIREAYGIPRDPNLKLRDFPTLRHVIQFVYDRRPDLAQAPAAAAPAGPAAGPAAAPAPAAAAPAADAVRERILTLVEEKTGYPRDMLDLELDLEADLGVDTVKQAEMFAAIREAYGIPRDPNLKLRDFPTLRHVIQFVYDRRPDLAQAPAATPAAAAPAGPAVAPAPAAAAPAADAVRERILTLVEEKTGYPRDMLDLELDLEADLGVDTVKQAEMFAAIREAYGIPRDPNLKLRDFPTLRHVIQFVYDRRPDLRPDRDGGPSPAGDDAPAGGASSAAIAPGASASPAPSGAAAAAPAALRDVCDADQVPRRVPVPVLRPALARCKPTGVELGAGRRVVVALDRGGVGKALVRRLEKRGVEVLTVRMAADGTAPVAELERWRADGAIHGVYWLPALDAEPAHETLDLAAWRAALALRVKSLATTMRVLYEHIAGPGTFLVTATRLGGQHGYGDGPVPAPMGGAVTGFAKAYQRERPEALVKACDVGAGLKPAAITDFLIEETLRDPGAIEVGAHAGERWTIALVEQTAADGTPGMTLGPDSVFVVTGAAGSIVAAITADLAAASGGVFHLLDRVPAPDPENPDLARFEGDRDGLKRDIFERLKARGERATPALVERELAALERSHAAWSAIAAIRAAGGTATYHCVDLLDGESVARVVDAIRPHGRIDVLLHAAGLEISRTLPDKSPEEFDRVFDVKSDGWFNLLHAIGDLPLGATVAFSSIAGRFGNRGQTDYSAANDLLCKSTASFRAQRPETRGIVIDWTAWRDIGMAARGSIPQMMALAGIDMLAPAVGIPTVRRELTAGGRRGELVVADRLGVLAEERGADGGLDLAAIDLAGAGPMLGRVVRHGLVDGLVVETTLDPGRQPFLRDHQIDGTAVLPGVMGIEGFAEAAMLAAPGWRVVAVEDVDFLAPFKFYRGEPRSLILTAQPCAVGEELVVLCRLVGSRTLAGQSTPQLTTHFTGRVRLARTRPSLGRTVVPSRSEGPAVEADAIYRVYFHGPAYRVLAAVRREDGAVVGELTPGLSANHEPEDRPLQMAPRLIELCFQTAGIRAIAASGQLGLPRHVDRIRVSSGSDDRAEGGFAAVVTSPAEGVDRVDARVVAADGRVAVEIEGYLTVELPGGVPAAEQQAMHAVLA